MAKRSTERSGIFWTNVRVNPTRVGELYCLKHDKFIGRSLDLYGEWAQNEIDRLLQYVKPGDFVLDIGANMGFHTLSFARRVGHSGKVWAFEPDPVNGILLRLNILNSGMDAVAIPFDTAVSDAEGLCPFRSYPISMPENFGHTAIDQETGDYPRIALSLDSLAIDRAPALIKIDIEGHEIPALHGMRKLLEHHRPVLSVEADTDQEADAIADVLCELGYDVYDFVTDAFNPANFAGREEDIWKGHGRCANLLGIMPGRHDPPEDLPLRRSASGDGSLARIGRKVGAAYAAGVDTLAISGPGVNDIGLDLRNLRADVRSFVSGFLRSAIGRLDADRYGELIHSALDYLAAENAQAESNALRKTLIAGVDSFGRAVTQTYEVEARLAKSIQELETANLVRGQLETQLDDAQKKTGDLAEKLAAALAKADAARKVADETNIVLARQSSAGGAEVHRLQDAAEQAKAEAQAAGQARAAIEKELAQRIDEIVAANGARAQADERVASAEAELASMKAAFEEVQNRLAAQSQEIRRLRATS